MRRTSKLLGAVIVAGALSAPTYAFTAANTVADSKAGSGAGGVTGYAITDIDYTLGATPTSFSSLTFNVAGAVKAGSNIKVSAGSAWGDCTAGTELNSKTPITCSSFTGAVADLTTLSVVIVD